MSKADELKIHSFCQLFYILSSFSLMHIENCMSSPTSKRKNLRVKERDQEISTRLKSRKFVSSLEDFFFSFSYCSRIHVGFLSGVSGKEPACQCRRFKRHGFDPWVRKIP